jgi:hypothetical protein
MAIMGLNLPTDVPWEQLCVTEDMMAAEACEIHHPPKWRSSIAVARYVPDVDYQVYPGRKVSYLKVTCTVSGYQPRDREVEGRINFGGVSVQTIADLDSLLDAYLPCTGALIQVAVSPRRSGVSRGDYPYFMDFQPKKRELYEMVTETGERSSRSLEDLRIGKASGTSQSQEVLDIDQGGSAGGSVGVSYAGVGVSGSYQSSTQGQWGTKQVGAQESSVSRSTDESREKRETESHSTQLSQMYHLLDSYHLGTNRAIFFVQPRPHILEVPTGFVRGPRSVEGIQEFFLVVNQPVDQDGFEVSVRLDTSHLTVVPIMDYDRSRTATVSCSATVDIPTRDDAPDTPQQASLQDSDGDRVGTIYYNCFKREQHNSTPYVPDGGYKIDLDNNGGYIDLANVASHGSSHVDVDPAGGGLTVFCDATGHVCNYADHDITVGYWAPDNVEADNYKWPAHVQRDVLAFLISREPTQKVGEKNVLLITTRELCCGGSRLMLTGVSDVIGLVSAAGKALSLPPSRFAASKGQPSLAARRESDRPAAGQTADGSTAPPAMMAARDANDLTATIRNAMIQSAGSRARDGAPPISYIETDLFHQQFHRRLLQSGPGRDTLRRPVTDVANAAMARHIARHFKRSADEIECGRIAAQSVVDLAAMLRVSPAEARQLKLACLGVPLNEANGSSDPDGRPPLR